jgi:tetratricopeptide (TPR) repeat protein
LARAGPGRPRLLARKPHLSYYADAVPVAFVPATNLESLAASAREQHADYLFMSWPEAELRPAFAFLLVPEFAPPGLTLVSAGAQGHATLYRIGPEFGRVLPAWYPREWQWRAAEGMTRVRPNDANLWLATGEGRHSRREFDGAHQAYDRAPLLHPRWAPALLDRANLDADMGRLYEARAGYEAALAAGESEPRLLAAYAITLARLGDQARATEFMRRYVDVTHDASFIPALGALAAGAPPAGALPAAPVR